MQEQESEKQKQFCKLILIDKNGHRHYIRSMDAPMVFRMPIPVPIYGVRPSDPMPNIEPEYIHYKYCGKQGDYQIYQELEHRK